MKYALLQWLACPACGAQDLGLDTRRVRTINMWQGRIPEGTPGYDAATGELRDVQEGTLFCTDCDARYDIIDGIPRMVLEDPVLTHSAHTGTRLDASAPEWEASFLDFVAPLEARDFVGMTCIDVGCGFGRGAFFAARYGAEVVAVDLDLAILKSCRENTAASPRVHVVQADANKLPFATSAFDLAYAFGLLHHLNEPAVAFAECSRVVRSGGRFSVWVYGPRQGTSAALSALARGITREMPSEELLNVSRLIASGIRLGSHTPYRVLRHVPFARPLVSHLPLHDHHQWPYEVVVADIFDRLRIPVTHTFTREQIEARYVNEGYLDVKTTRRVRNNESFRATGIRR